MTLWLWSESKSSGISKKPLESRRSSRSDVHCLRGRQRSASIQAYVHSEELFLQWERATSSKFKLNDTAGQGAGANSVVLTHQKEKT